MLYNDKMGRTQHSHLRLVVRQREIAAFRDVLAQVKHMPPQRKQAWLDSNAEAMQSAFSIFVDASEKTLQSASKDSQSIDLTYQLVATLKEAEALVAEVFHQPSAQLHS